MSNRATNKIIVEGVTRGGRKFRPSDWAERMCGALSTFGRDMRIQYSPLLQPVTINGIKCLAVDPELRNTNPEIFSYIMYFANENELNVVGCAEEDEMATHVDEQPAA